LILPLEMKKVAIHSTPQADGTKQQIGLDCFVLLNPGIHKALWGIGQSNHCGGNRIHTRCLTISILLTRLTTRTVFKVVNCIKIPSPL